MPKRSYVLPDKRLTDDSELAWDGDNLVRAIEICDHRLLMGEQWHPECLPYLGYQLRLFRCLMGQARDPRQERLL